MPGKHYLPARLATNLGSPWYSLSPNLLLSPSFIQQLLAIENIVCIIMIIIDILIAMVMEFPVTQIYDQHLWYNGNMSLFIIKWKIFLVGMNTTQKINVEEGYAFEGKVAKIRLCDITQKVMTQNVNYL